MSPYLARSQEFEVVDSIDIDILIRDYLIGSACIDISNVSFVGYPSQVGVFSNLNPLVGIENGIILSTGMVDSMGERNTKTNTTYPFSGTSPLDPDNDLALAANAATPDEIEDKVMIEFDFVALEDSFEFEYIFASEEYCDFVLSTKNDVFGFFLSGPGVNGPYDNNARNIARIPGTSTGISINTVNHKINSEYYIDNTPINQGQRGEGDMNCMYSVPLPNGDISLLQSEGLVTQDFTFDGFTKSLKAKEFVTPGETYHLKIALADVSDEQYDSAVLLRLNSFEAGTPKARIDEPDLFDCTNPTMELTSSESSRGNQFDFEWITTNGHIISGKNDTTVVIGAEGTYGLIVRRGTQCGDTAFTEVNILGEPPIITMVNADTINCERMTSNINAEVINTDDVHFQIIYPNGSMYETTTQQTFNSVFEGLHRYVVVNQVNQCTDTFEFNVVVDTLSPMILNDVNPDVLNCYRQTLDFVPNIDINASASFLWTSTNGNILSNPTNLILETDQPGDYTLELTNNENKCQTSRRFTIVQNLKTPVADFPKDTFLHCKLEEFTATVDVADITDVEVQWFDEARALQETGVSFTTSSPQAYLIQLTDTISGCQDSAVWTLTEDGQRPLLSIADAPQLDCENQTVSINANYEGPDATFQVTTQGGRILSTENGNLTIQVDQVGEYIFTARTTEHDCLDTISFNLQEDKAHVLIELDTNYLLDCDEVIAINPVITPTLSDFEAKIQKGNENSIDLTGIDTSLAIAGSYVYFIKNKENGCIDSFAFDIEPISNNYLLDYHFIYRNCKVNKPEIVLDEFGTAYDDQKISAVKFDGAFFQAGDTIDLSNAVKDSFSIAIGNCEFNGDYFTYESKDSLETSLAVPVELLENVPFEAVSTNNREADEIISYQWNPSDAVNCASCPTVNAVFSEDGELIIVTKDIYGCVDTAKTDILVDFIINLFIPNAFSPNGDNINDYFQAFGNANVLKVLSLKVHDRWGNQIYSMTDAEEIKWNGLVHGKDAPEGLYGYHLTFLGRDNKVYSRSGSVQLMR